MSYEFYVSKANEKGLRDVLVTNDWGDEVASFDQVLFIPEAIKVPGDSGQEVGGLVRSNDPQKLLEYVALEAGMSEDEEATKQLAYYVIVNAIRNII